MTAITDLSDPLSDEELERLQTILLDRVDEDAVTDGKDEGVGTLTLGFTENPLQLKKWLIVDSQGAKTAIELAADSSNARMVYRRKNAEALASAGAADLLLQMEATGGRLADRVLALAADGAKRRRMSTAARQLARPDAAKAIVDRGLELVGAR